MNFGWHKQQGGRESGATGSALSKQPEGNILTEQIVAPVPRKHAEVIKAWADGIDVQHRSFMSNGEWRDLEDGEQPNFFGSAEWRVKPVKAYPVTGLSHNALADIYFDAFDFPVKQIESTGAVAIANAALRHAIDADQVVTKIDHEAALTRLGEQLGQAARKMALSAAATLQRLGYTDCGGELWKPPLGKPPIFDDRQLAIVGVGTIYGSKRALDYVANCLLDPYPAKRAARDMAIAEAVRKFCENKAANDSTKYAAYKAIQDADLEAIIAGVRP